MSTTKQTDKTERIALIDKCECEHERHNHVSGAWECKCCDCKGFKQAFADIPDIFG